MSNVQTAASATAVNYPIVAALLATERILGKDRKWSAVNTKQQVFLETVFNRIKTDVPEIPEIESISSRDYTRLNSFLKDKGFDIQLEPFQPSDFGVVSVLKLVMEWLKKGEVTTITVNDTSYPAVRMKKNGVSFYRSINFKHTIIQVKTKTEDVVYLTAVDEPVAESKLWSLGAGLLETRTHYYPDYLGVIFPMIDLDTQPDISWLQGMYTMGTDGRPGIISQAKQQTRFKMDELGATVESAVTMGLMRSMLGPTYYKIDRPFLAVVHRPSLKQPIFVGYLNTDCWKQPKR